MMAPVEDMVSRDLLAFQLFTWLGKDCSRSDEEIFLAMLDSAERLAADSFLSCHGQADTEEPRLENGEVRVLPAIRSALRRYAEAGLFGASFPESLGGLALPMTATLALQAVFAAANLSAIEYPMLTVANARLLTKFGSDAQIATFARPQIEGRWFGTMCLSEPQAGSSLADIRMRATSDGEDGFGARYRLTGNKMWISGGDQDASGNIVHLVLAKIAPPGMPLPSGTKSISLFIVPKFLPNGERNDIAVAGLNHKLGHRGIANCLLNFGERQGALGWRVGAEGQGLAQMFMMMNEARIGVGMNAAALAYRGYRLSVRYAAERRQGRPVGVQGGPPVPIIEHPDVRRMLLQQKSYAEGALALCMYCGALADQRNEESDSLLALLTPAAKSWPSEFGVIANDLAIQVHGGYGYTRDFSVEQLWRDNRLNPIHEGTTGIQALDLLRRKLLLTDGKALAALQARVTATVAAAESLPEWGREARLLRELWRQLGCVVDTLHGVSGTEAFDDATLFLRAFGHGVVGWLWLDQALAAARLGHGPARMGIEHTSRFFLRTELPQAAAWLAVVAAHDGLARAAPAAIFA